MIRPRKKKEKKGAPHWMTTFSDLMTLILVFFILLFSFSEVDANKFRMISQSFSGVLDESSTLVPMDNPISSPITHDNPPVIDKNKTSGKDKENEKNKNQQSEMDKLQKKVQTYLKEQNLEGVIMVTRDERGIALVLQENVLFDSGNAVVKKEAQPLLDEVANLLITIPNMVEVEGHTDSQKILQPSQYTSNWNLSGDRAANVVNYLVTKHNMSAERFKISGYADTKPVASNGTYEGRLQNRRVVIVILDSEMTN